MPLDLLLQCGLVLIALVIAFAISAAVGIVVAWLWVTPRSLGGAPDKPGPPPPRTDPALEAPATGPLLEIPPRS
jgi:hypothetical protein